MDSVHDTPCGVGCPIRRSRDQSLLAAPPSFSQRATSFIASQRQGIHQMPFISSTRPSDNRTKEVSPHATAGQGTNPRPCAKAGDNTKKLELRRLRSRNRNEAGQHTHTNDAPAGSGRSMPMHPLASARSLCSRPHRSQAPRTGNHHHHTMSKSSHAQNGHGDRASPNGSRRPAPPSRPANPRPLACGSGLQAPAPTAPAPRSAGGPGPT